MRKNSSKSNRKETCVRESLALGAEEIEVVAVEEGVAEINLLEGMSYSSSSQKKLRRNQRQRFSQQLKPSSNKSYKIFHLPSNKTLSKRRSEST